MKVVKPFGRALPKEVLRVSLCDQNPEVVDRWIDFFRDLDAVEIVQGNLLDLDGDALVSPANSFGDMSGGLDKQIDLFHEGTAQRAVTAAIRDQFLGELPVGAALVVPLEAPRFPFLVAAPTMRVPRNVAASLNAYLAFRATLVAVLQHNTQSGMHIRSLAVPGLCTGVGGMGYGASAQQMRAAYDNVIGGGWREVVHPAMAPFGLAGGNKHWSLSNPE